jgi:signal transduction histidine kinase
VIIAGGERVEWVLAGGPSWRSGIRTGQAVVELRATTDPRDWRLVTSDGDRVFTASYLGQEAALREAVVAAVVACLLAGVGWLALRRLPIAVALAAMSTVLSSLVISVSGYDVLSTAASVAAVLMPTLWLGGWGLTAPRARVLAVVAAAAVSAGWLLARYTMPVVYEPVEFGRQGAMAGGLIAMVVVLADWKRWRGRLLSLEGTHVADLIALVSVVALSVFIALIIEAPLVVLVIVALGALLLYPRLRRRLASTIDQVLVGEIRDRASLRAVEEERGRIARDLHDEPLQEIAAVIRQLDGRPDTRRETDLLRQAAGHLRRVTTELRPPVLDDLGLRAAIAFVAEQAAVGSALNITASIEPDDPLAERPPAEVEVAVFRIVQEAVDNALRHADATSIEIMARVVADEVEATVRDDGRGIADGVAREAMRSGHIGLASMSQRAGVIDASFDVSAATPHGTIVRVHWRES